MFRFVFALTPTDTWDPAMTAEGFVGVECDGEPPAGVAVVGRRATGPIAGGSGAADFTAGGGYLVIPPTGERSVVHHGTRLAGLASATDCLILAENGGAFSTALDLWNLLEAAHHGRVKVAIDAAAARAAHQSPAVLVPTLNLRIGLVRIRDDSDDPAAYARRLAGIGFEGWVVLDPPAGTDRVAGARALAATFRGIFPAKPAKKAAPAKAAG